MHSGLLVVVDHELAGAQHVHDFLRLLGLLHLPGSGADFNFVHEEAARVELVKVVLRPALGRCFEDEGA